NGSPIWAPFTVKYDTDKREISHLDWRFLELSGIPEEKYISDDENQTRRVDSQSTLGGGVVVQVSGELSNAGEPMRRFTQTFVLALQSPKKYYVHNDIFRYQDEIITDEDCDGDMRGEVAEERLDRQVLGEAQGLTQPIAPAPVIPYYGGAVPPAGTALPSLPAQPSTVVPHQPIHVLSAQPQVGQLSQTASLNGHPDDLAILQVLGNQSPVIPQVEEVQEQDPVEEPVNDEGYGDSCDAAVEQEVTAEPGLSRLPLWETEILLKQTDWVTNMPVPEFLLDHLTGLEGPITIEDPEQETKALSYDFMSEALDTIVNV
ncbi:hypothetical protein D910_09088, partial [Dendroctonus ponderosae]